MKHSLVLLLLTVPLACSSRVSEMENSIPQYDVYVGMPAEEFARANSISSELVGAGTVSFEEAHAIRYIDARQAKSLVIPRVGGSRASATSVHILPQENGERRIDTVQVYLQPSPKPGEGVIFDHAAQHCHQAIALLEGAGWTGTTEGFFRSQASVNPWKNYAELLHRLPQEPGLSGVGVDARALGEVQAICEVVRNDFIARDLGFSDGLRAHGNDPDAKMYFSVLSFAVRNW